MTTGERQTNWSPSGEEDPRGMADAGNGAMERAKDTAQDLAARARDTAQPMVDERMSEVTAGLVSVADAIRQSSRELRDRQQAVAAGFTEGTADRIQRASNYLEHRDMRRVLSDIEDF